MHRTRLTTLGVIVLMAVVQIGVAARAADPGSADSTADVEPELAVTTGSFQAVKLESITPIFCGSANSNRIGTNRSSPECLAIDAIQNGAEGWAKVSMMVDAKGKPFEAAVIESTGEPLFEAAALEQARRARYRPAMENGKPTESVATMTYKYVLIGATGASSKFIDQYKVFTTAVIAKDRSAADTSLQALKATNLYEDAYFGIAKYQYAKLWGTPLDQRHGLDRALMNDSKNQYLPSDLHRGAIIELFNLQVQDHLYAEALDTSERILKLKPEEHTTQQVTAIVDQIRKVKDDATSYDVKAEINHPTTDSWAIKLYKRHFRIAVGEGAISTVKLRCQKHFASFDFNPSMQYEVSSTDGACLMELIGSPGSTFTLTQF